jgi:DNA-binding response OmpR family regulator
VIEDDLALADILAFTLRRAGFETVMAHDGLAGLEHWQADAPDLVLLDLNLPTLDGMSVCRRISGEGSTPVIILSVRSSDDDVVQGFRLGADDFIVKPFSPRQLVARIEAVLRRATGECITPSPLAAGDFTLDLLKHTLWRDGDLVACLTPLENKLLEVLIRNSGQVVPTETLIDRIWGPAGGDRTMLKQLVYRVRNKIDRQPAAPSFLETYLNVGYAFIPEADLVPVE